MPKETCWLRDWQNLCEPRIWRRHPKIALSLYRRLLDVRIDQTVLYFSTRHYLAHMENILKGLLGNKPLLPYRYHQRMINTVNEHVRSLKSEAYWVPPEPPTTGDQFFNALILGGCNCLAIERTVRGWVLLHDLIGLPINNNKKTL